MSVVLVTGVAGFLGRHIARRFRAAGFRIVGIDSSPEENAPRELLDRYASATLPHEAFASCVIEERPSIVIHCAGRASVPLSIADPTADFDNSPLLTFRLLEVLRHHAPECRFVLLSSAAVYGDPPALPVSETALPSPISPYGFHKRQAELACQEFAVSYGLRAGAVRIFSAYGPGLRRQVLWDLANKAMSQDVLRLMGTGNETRDFVHARDVAQGVEIVARHAELRGELYNLASGQETSIASIAERIVNRLNETLPIEFDGVAPQGMPLQWRADIDRLTTLGYQPTTPFDDGLDEYLTWVMPLLT